jgi:hypothetical protein
MSAVISDNAIQQVRVLTPGGHRKGILILLPPAKTLAVSGSPEVRGERQFLTICKRDTLADGHSACTV